MRTGRTRDRPAALQCYTPCYAPFRALRSLRFGPGCSMQRVTAKAFPALAPKKHLSPLPLYAFTLPPLLPPPDQPVELDFLFQGTQCLFDVPGLDPYPHDLPPPPPRSPLPPPPDPERSVLGLASFTVIVRSMNDVPFMAVIALAASSSDAISTKPNPLDLPFV